MPTGIYLIKNKITGDSYIGSASKSISSRWGYHKRDLRANKHHSSRLQNSWNKHGEESFLFEIIEECLPSACIEREQFYIDSLNPTFNMNPIAGNCSGRVFSEKSKQKMSLSAKKRGINQFLLNQQKPRAIFNEIGEKQCSKCSNFKDIFNFKNNTNMCRTCINKSRPSRKLQNPRGRVPIIAENATEKLEFDKMNDAVIFFKNKGIQFSRKTLRVKIKNNLIYHGYKWSAKCL